MSSKSRKSAASALVFGAVLGLATMLLDTTRAHAIPLDGASERSYTVEANRTHVFDVVFRGGERAQVGVFGNRASDLDIFVYDDRGQLVVQANGVNDREWAWFTPRFTASYRVEVRNLGSVWNAYRLVLN